MTNYCRKYSTKETQLQYIYSLGDDVYVPPAAVNQLAELLLKLLPPDATHWFDSTLVSGILEVPDVRG